MAGPAAVPSFDKSAGKAQETAPELAPQPRLPGPYADLLALQRAAGNRAVNGLLQPGGAIPPIVDEVLRSPGQPLDPALQAHMEARFGQDFSQVRLHTDAHAAESAEAVNARAYTVGRNVAFGAGRYAPTSGEGLRLLAHELAHVVQQGRGGAAPTMMSEADADQAANQAGQGQTAQVHAGVATGGMQRQDLTLEDIDKLIKDRQLRLHSRTEAEKAFETRAGAALRAGPSYFVPPNILNIPDYERQAKSAMQIEYRRRAAEAVVRGDQEEAEKNFKMAETYLPPSEERRMQTSAKEAAASQSGEQETRNLRTGEASGLPASETAAAERFQGPSGTPIDPNLVREAINKGQMNAKESDVIGGYPLKPGVYDPFMNFKYLGNMAGSIIVEREGQYFDIPATNVLQYIRLWPAKQGVWNARIWAVAYPWLIKKSGEGMIMSGKGTPFAVVGAGLYKLGEAGIQEAAEVGIPEAIELERGDPILEISGSISPKIRNLSTGEAEEVSFKAVSPTDELKQQTESFQERTGLRVPEGRVLEAPWVGKYGERSTSEGWLRDDTLFWRKFREQFKDDAPLIPKDNTVTPELAQKWGWDQRFVGEKMVHHHGENGPYVWPIPQSVHRDFSKLIHRKPSKPVPGREPKFRSPPPRLPRVRINLLRK